MDHSSCNSVTFCRAISKYAIVVLELVIEFIRTMSERFWRSVAFVRAWIHFSIYFVWNCHTHWLLFLRVMPKNKSGSRVFFSEHSVYGKVILYPHPEMDQRQNCLTSLQIWITLILGMYKNKQHVIRSLRPPSVGVSRAQRENHEGNWVLLVAWHSW